MKLLRGMAFVLIGASTAVAQQNWLLRSESGPSPRSHHAMAFDSLRGVTVLFGGTAGAQQLTDTWEWNGDAWTQRQPAHSPPSAGRLVFDVARGVSVLVRIGQTWEWNGVDWTLASNENVFPIDVAYDPARARTVVLSQLANGTSPAIVNEWDGVAWHQIATASGPFFTVMSMAWSPGLQRVVAYTPFQGFSSPTAGARLWQWDGATWTSNAPITTGYNSGGRMVDWGNGTAIYGGNDGSDPIFGLYQPFSTTGQVTPASPLGRGGHAIVHDTVRNRLVLFGGYWQKSNIAAQVLSGDTWEYVSGGGLIATSEQYGQGCGAPAPTISTAAGSRPVLGQTFIAEVTDAALGATLVAFGPSNQVAQSFYGATLPLDLGFVGMPGCPMLASPDLLLPCGAGGVEPDFVLTVPNAPTLNGVQAYLQAFTFRPGANPANLVASNGLQVTLGDQ